MAMTTTGEELHEMLSTFVERIPGVTAAAAVSADGILLSSSTTRPVDGIEQFAAITTGLTSMAVGVARCVGYDDVEQLIVEMSGGFLFVMAVGDGSTLGVLAERECEIGTVGYEMTMLLNRVGTAITPAVVAELTNPLVS